MDHGIHTYVSSGNVQEHSHRRESSNEPKRSRCTTAAQNIRSKVSSGSKIIFRALGFSAITSALKVLRHPFGRGYEEPIKIAVHKSRLVASLRAVIHVIPVGVALWEIMLNWNTYYVGSYAYNLVYYQFAAKAHEIAIQASLAAVAFSYIRYEMVLGKGLPFGALFSGLQLNSVSYLWSMEFWGSLGSKHLPIRRKIAMLVIVSICFILAAAAGPSSAILLIPRLDYWPAGSTHVWVNSTSSNIWPDRLDASSVPHHCAISQDFSLSYECPSSEWNFMQTYNSLGDNSIPRRFREITHIETVKSPHSAQLTGKNAFRQFQFINLSGRHNMTVDNAHDPLIWLPKYAVSTTQQAVIADALEITGALWDNAVRMANSSGHHGSPLSDQHKAVHRIAEGYFQPYSMVYCARDTIKGVSDERPIAFPISPGIDYNQEPDLLDYANTTISGIPAIDHPSIIRAQLLETMGTGPDHRVQWVELPQDLYLGNTIGVIILLPQNSTQRARGNESSDLVVCNIGAGWGSTTINTTTFQTTISAASSLLNYNRPFSKDQFHNNLTQFKHNESLDFANYYQTITDLGVYYQFPHYPSKQVVVDQAWAEYLNPFVPALNTNVIDALMKASGGKHPAQPEVIAQRTLSGLMTNGLARTTFTSQLQGTMKLAKGVGNTTDQLDSNVWVSGHDDFFTVDPDESKDWVKLRVDSTIQGYAYNTRGAGPKVAIAFLLTYCALALAHCFYSVISGISSTSWDSIAEITALAVNSSPTNLLRNTCAGITESHIFKTPVRILVMSDEEGEGEHLELVFGDVDEKAEKRTIETNRRYGTMSAMLTSSSEHRLVTQ